MHDSDFSLPHVDCHEMWSKKRKKERRNNAAAGNQQQSGVVSSAGKADDAAAQQKPATDAVNSASKEPSQNSKVYIT